MSRIYDALTIAEDQVVERIQVRPTFKEPNHDFSGPRGIHLPADISSPWEERAARPELPGKVSLSPKKVRVYLLLAFLMLGGALTGTNYALRSKTGTWAKGADAYGISFEGTLRPASEIRVTSASLGTVSAIYVKVGDTVKSGQQLIRMDDRDSQLGLRQAVADRQTAQANIDSFRSRLAEANARVAVAQRQAAAVPGRQYRDSPKRAQAAFDQAQVNYSRAKKLFDAGVIAQQELDARATDLRMAQDDLDNARKLAGVSAKLEEDQSEQANLEAKVTRQDLLEKLRQADLNYQEAKQRMDESVILATQDGVVAEIPVKLGDRVPGGTVMAKLAELRRMVADVPVAASMIASLQVGEPVSIKLPSTPPTDVKGTIRTINPLPSPNMTHNVEVEFENPTLLLLAGQPAEARFMKP